MFRVQANETMVFQVSDGGNVGIRETNSNVDLNVQSGSGTDTIFRCEKADGLIRFRVDQDGDIWAPGLSSTVIGWHDLIIESNGKIKYATSSRRYKENIEPFADDFDLILQTELKQWTGKGDDSGRMGFGFIAEEIKELGLESLVLYDKDGRVDSLKFRNIPFYTLQVVKRHEYEIEALQAENEELRDRLAKLEELVERLAAK